MKVIETTDYNIFKDLKGNRPVLTDKVKKLIDWIRKENLLEEYPILVNERMEVIDGQHRLAAASQLQLPVFYVTRRGGDLRMTQGINDNIKQWSYFNFLESFIAIGKEDYIILKKYISKYQFGVMISAYLLTGTLASGDDKNAIRDDFKSGDFKITKLGEATAFGEEVTKLAPYIEGDFWSSMVFLRAMEVIFQEIESDVLRQKIASSAIKLRRRPSIREYLRDFEEIVNFRNRKTVIRFKYGNQSRKKEVSKTDR